MTRFIRLDTLWGFSCFALVPGSRGAPEAGVRPHRWLVVSGVGALRDALWTREYICNSNNRCSPPGAHQSFCYLQPPFYSRNTAEMYNNILHKSPVLKPNVSNAGRDLLEGLLQKDRTKRLGVKDDFVSLHSPSWAYMTQVDPWRVCSCLFSLL